jgi:hypothetical protein
MKRYQVITHSPSYGAVERLTYSTRIQANAAAKEYEKESRFDGVIVYDLWKGRIVIQHGYWPEESLPLERRI